MKPRDPLQVTVAGVESIPGEGMELRLLVKLRVQNPNDLPVEYNGVAVEKLRQAHYSDSGTPHDFMRSGGDSPYGDD